MANSKNLKPQSHRTKSEQREIAKKGGIASGKARRERKLMRELLEIALDAKIANSKGKKATKKEVAAIRIANAMASGDLKAVELGMKILRELEDKMQVTVTTPRDLTPEEAAVLRKKMEEEY